jgi:inorganic triphosphatase YgiF
MRELELKFSLPLSMQDSLAREDRDDRIERVWSCYYDTPDGALARSRTAVRVRRKGEQWLQTVKADDGDRFERFEWERPIAGNQPERDALPPEDTPQGALAHRTFAQWRPLFETDFERRARRLEPAPGLTVELAQDVGEVRCAEHRTPIREVELECLAGSRAVFFAWALEWAQREQACLMMPTKNERGLRLAARLPLAPSPVKAAAVTPDAVTPTTLALAQVLRACVSHACANLEPILASDDPEGPHQLRVALRRLRAALRFAGLREQDERWLEIDAGAKAIADTAGRVRDLDVFETGALRTLRSRFRGDAAIETLSRSVVDAREAARMDLRRTLAGPATTRFVLRTLAMTETLTDRTDMGAFGAFAAKRLHALLARVRRRAGRAHDAEGWHRTRLAVKTLRYALDFAAQALPRGTGVERAQSLLARWQEQLGTGQDFAASREVAAGALSRPGVSDEAAVRALALIDGWHAFAPASAGEPRRLARRMLRELRDALRPAAPKAAGGPSSGSAGEMPLEVSGSASGEITDDPGADPPDDAPDDARADAPDEARADAPDDAPDEARADAPDDAPDDAQDGAGTRARHPRDPV